MHILSLSLAVYLLTPFVLAWSSPGTEVVLRIEGKSKTIFEGKVTTKPGEVTTSSGGTHLCDGTNNDANPSPGPTVTGALAAAAKEHGFEWDGTFFQSLHDFFITSIGGESPTGKKAWMFYVNYLEGRVGGCQKIVHNLDEVLWASNTCCKSYFLKLSGKSHQAIVGQKFELTVTDGVTRYPVAGADVDGQKSDANGKVWLTFTTVGKKGIKAEKEDAVRSNRFEVDVVQAVNVQGYDNEL